MKYLKKLAGAKVYLAPHNPDDAERYAEWVNDLEVGINMKIMPQIITVEQEHEILHKLATGSNPSFAIVDKDIGKPIGATSLFDIDPIHRTAMFGIFIGDRNYWNAGFGTEATNLVLDYGFHVLNLNNIALTVMSFNKRAIRCYEKCGFKLVGARRKACFVAGEYYDELIYDILAEEFEMSYIASVFDKSVTGERLDKLTII
jgi:RimJ/RimL family protein N-acetyltransferase